jgi:hypothetical protein
MTVSGDAGLLAQRVAHRAGSSGDAEASPLHPSSKLSG